MADYRRAIFRDLRRLRQAYSPTQLIVGAALLSAGLSVVVVVVADEGKLLDWFIQIVATTVAALLAVAGGIWLFRFQGRENDEKLEKKLDKRVELEIQLNLEILKNPPSPLFDLKLQPIGKAVLVALNTASLEDMIRSNLLEPEDAIRWMRLEAHINVHNREVDALLAARGGSVTRPSLQAMIAELNLRQDVLRNDLGGLLQFWREQGVEIPPYTERA